MFRIRIYVNLNLLYLLKIQIAKLEQYPCLVKTFQGTEVDFL